MKLLRNRKRLAGALAVLMLFLLGVWAFGHYQRGRHLAQVQELRQQLAGEAGRKLSADQRRELRRRFGEELKQLSPDQRRDLTKDRRDAMRDKLRKFFQLSKMDRTAALDSAIDRMEKGRKQRDSGTVGAATGPGPKGGWGSRSPQERERLRKLWLDATTPEERAQRAEYFRQLSQRRQQRGLSPMGFPGRG
jgi:hypothetical protein